MWLLEHLKIRNILIAYVASMHGLPDSMLWVQRQFCLVYTSSWTSVLAHVCKHRAWYTSDAPTTPKWKHCWLNEAKLYRNSYTNPNLKHASCYNTFKAWNYLFGAASVRSPLFWGLFHGIAEHPWWCSRSTSRNPAVSRLPLYFPVFLGVAKAD